MNSAVGMDTIVDTALHSIPISNRIMPEMSWQLFMPGFANSFLI